MGITTLIKDIYKLFDSPHTPAQENIKALADNLATIIGDKLGQPQQDGYLRPSNIGHPCERKLWYTINTPQDAEPLPPKVKFKFLYGDIIEALVLFLAREAGHTVEGCQEEVELHGVKGRRDAIIDGVLVDVKSANTRAYDKFEQHRLHEDDSFGYRDQLQFYLNASHEHVGDRSRAAFLAVDKELGSMCLDFHDHDGRDWNEFISLKRDMLSQPQPPERSFSDVPEGKSGNRKLTVPCSYCPFKQTCWPNLRTFMYSNGPKFLTHVEKEPRPEEVTNRSPAHDQDWTPGLYSGGTPGS